MTENSDNTSCENDISKAADDTTSDVKEGTGLLKLEFDESDIPEIKLDVTNIDTTTEEKSINEDNSEKNFDLEESDNKNALPNSSPSSKPKSSVNINSIPKTKPLNFVWVSNINQSVKATDIKKFFSQIGKVTSVKILSNGQKFYGYVSMETPQLAAKCISDLNESLFRGEKIIVSKKRPNLLGIKTDNVKKNKVNNKENKNKDQDTGNKVLDENTIIEKVESNNNKLAFQLREQMQNKIESLNYANKKLKQRLEDVQCLYDGMCRKYRILKEDLDKAKIETRQENRRLNQEKELFEKTKKNELIKIEENKIVVNKELAEVRKLKENLKQKLNDIKKDRFKRERSPLTRSVKSPRRRDSPTSGDGNFYRGEKKFRGGTSRERTPPPSTAYSDKKRNQVEHMPPRPPYYSQVGKTQVSESLGNRQRTFPSFQSRGDWTGYTRNFRRTNSTQSHMSNPEGRYNAPLVQHPTSAIVVPPRAPHGSYYYPQW